MSSYPKSKGRSDRKTPFVGLPKEVVSHENFTRLSGWATKLLILIASQYNGYNNGDSSATWRQAKRFGFNSPSTLVRAKAELLHYGLIVNTRPGGKNSPTLYAMTWQPIDHCGDKLYCSSTKKPTGEWKESRSQYVAQIRTRNLEKKSSTHMSTNVVAIRTS